ncbi:MULTISPECIES: tRNA (guanosine(46)-N7)-methyltransferase TrmB [unclassified Duganella]|uniref:tRNA (guanosine(46)-N7)-methyltransferase TrmB n=1 Tax=unclassified Duganella TaxID=2636909 RepID=UPI0006F2CA46|nr:MULTISPECIES: tRNA (guanosine(46)-N7)-methyltransferase TrmB [unclassified Duganella]KQV47854.1 tRNA (guanine-N7)-methyltransferase [Duganella sp. Root336D2]KRB82138.1 tRNA (guanine-N7)-methyltransferase [Duganella sp. Root198D2]
MLYDPTEHRIRSFVTRAGRLSTGQERGLKEFGPQFLIEHTKEALDYEKAFGRKAPVILEIGFGMGGTTAHIAKVMPEKDFIGVEVHTPGVGSLLKMIGDEGIPNLRVIQHDAVEVLRDMIPAGSLAGVHIYFPDPWHKARHNKRRLIQPAFVKTLCEHLAPGGYIHLATDWEDYAVQMLEVLGAEPALQNTAEGYAPQPAYRPLTKFENRGLKLGHGVWDLVFTKK